MTRYEIEMQEMSEDFFQLWKEAGDHLDKQVDGGIRFWLRAHPYPPLLEHLSFRLGNQMFFVRIIDVEGNVSGPGSIEGLEAAARDANGHACLLPMRRVERDGTWVADAADWGLLDAKTGQAVNPFDLVTDEKIAMTLWEVHDMAVQVVRGYIEREGFILMSWQGNPKVDPSIWFLGKTTRPEWVVVRSTQFPASSAPRPPEWDDIATSCSRLSDTGHFASVAIASAEQRYSEALVPLWRGHALHVNFKGLESASVTGRLQSGRQRERF